MPSIGATTIPGVDGGIVSIDTPDFSIVVPGHSQIFTPGTADAAAAISAAVANGTAVSALFDGTTLPPPPAGTTGYAIDTIAGAVLDQPSGYRYIADAASGATTIAVNSAFRETALFGTAPVFYFESNSVSTVYAAGSGSLFDFEGSYSDAVLAGGNDTIFANGGADLSHPLICCSQRTC